MPGNNVVELIVKVTDAFTGPLRSIHGALDDLSRKFTGLGVDALASFALIAKGFQKIFEESTQAELAAVKFGAAFDAMGAHIGIAREEMEKFAKASAETTRFSREQVQGAQTVLLRFVDVQGVVFERAQKLSLDLAEAMGTDAASAAQLLGRAMESPILSARLLRQVGVYLTEQQKDQIKVFLESGHQMQAQKIVLDELQARYGGLADKVGKTTAGAVAQLQHAFDDLFKVQDQFGPINDAVKTLTETLKDPDVVRNVQDLFGFMVRGAAAALEGINLLVAGYKALYDGILAVAPSTRAGTPTPVQGSIRQFQAELEGVTQVQMPKYDPHSAEYQRLQAYAATLRQYIQQLTLQFATQAKGQQFESAGYALPDAGGGYGDKTQSDPVTAATAAKKAADEMQKALEKASVDTQTAFGKAFEDVTDKFNALEQLLSKGWIDQYTQDARLAELANKDLAKSADDAEKAIASEVDASTKHNISDAMELNVKNINEALKGVGEYSKAQLQAISGIQNAFAAAFNSIGTGIKGMLRAFLDAIKQMAAQAAAASLTDAIFGKVDEKTGKRTGGGGGLSGTLLNVFGGSWSGGGGSGGGGGFLSDLIHGIVSLFGGSGGGTPAGGTGADFPGAHAASGGDISAGLTLVGENGPELIGTGGPARVWNNQQLAFAMGGGGGGGMTYAPTTQINVGGSMDKATEQRIYRYIEATRARDKREVVRVFNERQGLRR